MSGPICSMRGFFVTLTWCLASTAMGLPVIAHAAPEAPGAATAPVAEAASDPADHNYPTYERVRYVIACITTNGGAPALVYQCSCAIDHLAEHFTLDDFIEMQTALNAAPIAGERGAVLRDSPDMRYYSKRYRDGETAAFKACGIKPGNPH